MAEVNDWLDARIQEIINAPGFHEIKAEFRDQAKILVDSGEAEGSTVAQIKKACRVDVERYLLDQQNAMTDVELQRKVYEKLEVRRRQLLFAYLAARHKTNSYPEMVITIPRQF